MTYPVAIRRLAGAFTQIFEHPALIVAGFVPAVVGLALGVTTIMLPLRIVVGLVGVVMMVGGLFAHID